MTQTPTILAFDTSGPYCAAALYLHGKMATRIDDMAKGQAEHLMPMLEQMLSGASISWTDLDGLGVGIGPGNFTGIRIAVSAARGLALGLDKPAIGVSGFETQIFGADRPATAIIPAPRDQVYMQCFRADGHISPPEIIPKSAAPAQDRSPTPAQQIAAIAAIAATRLDQPQPRPTPLYVRDADAAPPRDPAPAILE